MTDQQLDDVLYRTDTCPDTVSVEEAEAAQAACEVRGWAAPEALTIIRVTRLLLPDRKNAA